VGFRPWTVRMTRASARVGVFAHRGRPRGRPSSRRSRHWCRAGGRHSAQQALPDRRDNRQPRPSGTFHTAAAGTESDEGTGDPPGGPARGPGEFSPPHPRRCLSSPSSSNPRQGPPISARVNTHEPPKKRDSKPHLAGSLPSPNIALRTSSATTGVVCRSGARAAAGAAGALALFTGTVITG